MIGGIGIGITSTVCPVYNAEIAPAKYRGSLVALNQLAIVTGIFLVYFQNSWIVSLGMKPGVSQQPGAGCSEWELFQD